MYKLLVALITMLFALHLQAEPVAEKALSSTLDIEHSEPSVEDNIIAMDVDHDGMVTIAEMRVYVQAKHGAAYQHDVLKKMEAAADSRSCGSPFSGSFY